MVRGVCSSVQTGGRLSMRAPRHAVEPGIRPAGRGRGESGPGRQNRRGGGDRNSLVAGDMSRRRRKAGMQLAAHDWFSSLTRGRGLGSFRAQRQPGVSYSPRRRAAPPSQPLGIAILWCRSPDLPPPLPSRAPSQPRRSQSRGRYNAPKLPSRARKEAAPTAAHTNPGPVNSGPRAPPAPRIHCGYSRCSAPAIPPSGPPCRPRGR